MKQESETIPSKKYKIENIENGYCDIVLYDIDNIKETCVYSYEENIEKKSYIYYIYRIKMAYNADISDYIFKNYDKLLKNAKDKEYETLADEIRKKRNKLLDESDKEVTFDRLDIPKDITTTNIITVLQNFFVNSKSDWIKYRQELRDITKQEGFPFNVTFPEKPINTLSRNSKKN